MAGERTAIGDPLGTAIQAIKDQAVAKFLASRPVPDAPLSASELPQLMDVVWKAFGAAFAPISPDKTITIGTQLDAEGVPQLTLQASSSGSASAITVPSALYQLWRGLEYGLKDATGNARHLTVPVGTATIGALPSYGDGFVLDGETILASSDKSGLFQTTGDLSFVVAFKMTEMPPAGSYRPLVMISSEAEGDNIIVDVQADGNLLLYHEYGESRTSESHVVTAGIEVGKLCWLAVVRKGKALRVYLNGALTGTAEIANPPTGCTNNYFSIGGATEYPDWCIKAIVASVAFYKSALDPGEIKGLYRSEMMLWASSKASVSGSVPTGTGWRHVTNGVEDAAASTPSAANVGAIATGQKGAANGVASLDADQKLTASQLPSHASTHAAGQADAISIVESQLTLADNTTKDVSTSCHGLAPKLPDDSAKFLSGKGTWDVPAANAFANAFTTVYSVDFRTLPAQNLLTGGDGAKTIDGKSWSLVNSSSLQTAYVNDGTHSGLYLRCSTNNTSNDNGALTGGALYADLRNISATLSTGFLASVSEIWLWYLCSTPHTQDYNYEQAHAGLLWNFSSYAAGQLLRAGAANMYSGTAPYYALGHFNYNSISWLGGGRATPAVDVMVVRILPSSVEVYAGASVAGDLPAKTALFHIRSVPRCLPPTTTGGFQVQTNVLYPWMSVTSGNSRGNSDMLITRFKVEYR